MSANANANAGSLRHSFVERGRKYYSEVELDDYYVRHEGCIHRISRIMGEKLSWWWHTISEIAISAYEMGRSDPRKAVFAAKTGCALSLASLLIFVKEEPFSYITKHAVWAMITVVVVFEFSIGATLSKGLNRAVGTLSAGSLSLAIALLSNRAGQFREVVVAISCFGAAFMANYLKLHEAARQYEYGFRVFMMTFSIVMSSNSSEFVETAVARLVLIAVGAVTCLILNVCIYPIWSGEDLHRLVVKNFKGVATSLEGCINMYLQGVEYERIPSKILTYQASDDPLYNGYRTAVESTSEERTLLGFAKWEPPHGRYRILNYPWVEYVKLSGALRHCAFMVMAMHGCILSEIQAPSELRQVFKDGIQRVGSEGAKVLRLLGEKVENMEKLNPQEDPLEAVHDAAENLQMLIDQKSYLLVNAESWGSERRPQNLDPEKIRELKDNENKPFLIKSLSSLSTQTMRNYFYDSASAAAATTAAASGEDVFKNQTMWPSRLSLLGDSILNEREVRTYESASALSLATFTSLLIEFVARLQNLIHSYEQLSEKANFREQQPLHLSETNITTGFCSTLLKLICCRDS